MKLESEFALTRKTAQANSTTAKQISDENTFYNDLADTAEMIATQGGSLTYLTRIASKLSKNKKGTQASMDALEEVGDYLLLKGMQPERVRELLKKGNEEATLKIAKSLAQKPAKFPPVWAAAAITQYEIEE